MFSEKDFTDFIHKILLNLPVIKQRDISGMPALEMPLREITQLTSMCSSFELFMFKSDGKSVKVRFLNVVPHFSSRMSDDFIYPSLHIDDVPTHQHEYLFQGYSKLVFFILEKPGIDVSDEIHRILKYAGEAGINPVDIAVINIVHDLRYFPYDDLLQYIACAHFRSLGFISDPFSEYVLYTGGYPDLRAFSIPQLQNPLIEKKVIEKGFYLKELEFPFQIKQTNEKISVTKSIVCETKSSSLYDAVRALRAYTSEGYFHEGYAIVPFVDEYKLENENEFGIITMTEEGKLLIKECPKNHVRGEKFREIIREVDAIIKFLLIRRKRRNFLSEFSPRFLDVLNMDYGERDNILSILNKIPMEKLL